jgi:hypothetical protein
MVIVDQLVTQLPGSGKYAEPKLLTFNCQASEVRRAVALYYLSAPAAGFWFTPGKYLFQKGQTSNNQ